MFGRRKPSAAQRRGRTEEWEPRHPKVEKALAKRRAGREKMIARRKK